MITGMVAAAEALVVVAAGVAMEVAAAAATEVAVAAVVVVAETEDHRPGGPPAPITRTTTMEVSNT